MEIIHIKSGKGAKITHSSHIRLFCLPHLPLVWLQGHQSPALAWAKYGGTLAVTGASGRVGLQGDPKRASPHYSRRAQRLMAVLGVLDVACYVFNCVGEYRRSQPANQLAWECSLLQ